MRVGVVVAGGVPNPAQSGSALTVWTIVAHLLSVGHEVSTVILRPAAYDDPGATFEERVARLAGLGADVQVVASRADDVLASLPGDAASRIHRAWRPPDLELFPHLADAGAVREAIEEARPDVVFVYHWEALAATRALRGVVPRFATVVDLPQLSTLYRWRAAPGRFSRAGFSRLVWLQARLRTLPPLMVELLEECEAAGNFAAHHATWLRRRGARTCEYYRTPIEDRAGLDWRSLRRRNEPRSPRFLLIGHLRGASTIDGLDFFARSILPRLPSALGSDAFEVRIAGGYEPPAHLRTALERPGVSFLGHLEQPDEEFASADALIVPTTVPLGTRVRIISAWSFGCPVVAHTANAAGIPELANGVNAMLGRTGSELAGALAAVAADAALAERLAREGRATYERLFAPAVAAARIEETLTRIARAPAGVVRVP